MAGYIMTIGYDEYMDMFYPGQGISEGEAQRLSKEYALKQCISKGVYASHVKGQGAASIGILADYLGMKAGDEIYFFMSRKIYGIGKLINIAGIDCRFRIHPKEDAGTDELLIEESSPDNYQFVCSFDNSQFFKQGVDMDELLIFCPEKIRALRFFSQMTFMKLDDVESEAIKNVIVRKNEDYLSDGTEEHLFEHSEDTHNEMAQKLSANTEAYKLSVFDFMKLNRIGKVSSEYYLEGAIMDLLRQSESALLGSWDFVARQYPASPPKPPVYKDTMDLFGYRYVQGFPTAVSKYLIIELKAGNINQENIQQTMKYVDWISQEYTKGDYSMIEAYTIGYGEEPDLYTNIEDVIGRNYIIQGHPIENKKWSNLRVLQYGTLLNELRALQETNE